MRNPATQSTIRKNNQELIIEYIIEKGALSRASLAKELNISKPTISANVEKLISHNILLETGEGISSGGRKPTLINFNYDFKVLVAIDLNRSEPVLALSNLSGEILYEDSIEVCVTDGKEILTSKIITSINNMLIINHYKIEQLGAVAIAIPGVIDEKTNKVFANPQDHLWTEINLKGFITEYYKVPVVMKNDINMAALGEKYYGIGMDYDDLVYVSSGLGVGAGIILNGFLHEGKRKAAGEVGYSRLFGLNSPQTLEEYISISSIIDKIKDDIDKNIYKKVDLIDINYIKEAFYNEDEYIVNIVNNAAKSIGIIVANMALTLDLEVVILGGKLFVLGEKFVDLVRIVVNNSLPFETIVKKSKLGKKAGVYGLLVIARELVMKNIIE